MTVLDDALTARILAHAAREEPHEACGLLVQTADGLRYFECGNIAARPSETFEIDAADWRNAEAHGRIAAVVHSHPQGAACLSDADRQMQVQTGLPWLLVADGQIKTFRACPHLRGRLFDYGRYDCGTLVRDALMLGGLDFADYPRGQMDDDIARGIWPDCLQQRGFAQLPDGADLQAGDVLLTTYRGRPAHAVLYLGGGEILHHPLNGLSRREPYYGYWQDNTHSVWRHADWRPEMLAGVLNDLVHTG